MLCFKKRSTLVLISLMIFAGCGDDKQETARKDPEQGDRIPKTINQAPKATTCFAGREESLRELYAQNQVQQYIVEIAKISSRCDVNDTEIYQLVNGREQGA